MKQKRQFKIKNTLFSNDYAIFLITLFSLFFFLATPCQAKKPQDYDFYSKYGHKNKDWNKYVQDGFEAYERQDCKGTIDHLNLALSAQCKDALVYFKMAVCSELTGSLYSAEQYYQSSLQGLEKLGAYHRYKKDINLNYGRLLYSSQRFDEALKYLSRAAQSGYNDFALFYMLGEIHYSRGESDLAVSYYQKAINQDTSQASPNMLGKAHKEIARTFLNEKNYEAALSSIETAKKYLSQDQELINMSMQANQKMQENRLIHQLENFNKQHSR